jgi:hypothetical protein
MECDVIALNSFFENAGRDAIFQFVINEKLFSPKQNEVINHSRPASPYYMSPELLTAC